MRQFLKAVGVLLLVVVLVFIFRVGREVYYQYRYPLDYKTEIETQALAYNLDPHFIASVIWVESKFDASATSGKGAVGLMQIMPDTGVWIAGKLGVDEFSEQDLWRPETNIALGCWYLDYLSDRYDGETTLILAAYNGGPGRVDDWLANAEYTSNGNLHSIPYGETDDFVKRVKKTYDIYKELYTFYE